MKEIEEIKERDKNNYPEAERDIQMRRDIQTLLSSIETRDNEIKALEGLRMSLRDEIIELKEQSDHFRLETNRLTDGLAKEREKADELDTELRRIRLGIEGDYGDDPVEIIKALKERLRLFSLILAQEKERVIFWKGSYDEELAHSKRAEERIGQLENAIDEWTKLYHLSQEHADKMGEIITSQNEKRLELEDKIGELDDRIVSLVILADKYAMRITKAESHLNDNTSPIELLSLVEQLSERIKELESERDSETRWAKEYFDKWEKAEEKVKELESALAAIKADENIGKLVVEGSFGGDD